MKAFTVGWFCRSLCAPSLAGGITQNVGRREPVRRPIFCQRKDKPRSLSGGARLALRAAQNGLFWGVHNVHIVGFGFGCTGIGLDSGGFRGVADSQGQESGSIPTSGTCFPCSEAL